MNDLFRSVGAIPFPSSSSIKLKFNHDNSERSNINNSLDCKEDGKDFVYMKETIDPIISPAIIYVLKEAVTPNEIPTLFLRYFRRELDQHDTCVTNNIQLDVKLKRRRRRCVNTMKVSLELASFLSKLLTLVLVSKPKSDLMKFLTKSAEKLQVEAIPLRDVTSFSKNATKNKTSKPVELIFLLAGTSNSGKTTLVSVLRGQNNPNCKPSLGFLPVSLKYNENVTVTLYDVGGGKKIRGIWNNYYHEVHGVIYVVDSACSYPEFNEAMLVATETLGHRFIQGKPVLLISNKVDEPPSRPLEEIGKRINLNPGQRGLSRFLATSIHPSRCGYQGQPDPHIDENLKWLIETSLANLIDLNLRVKEDCEEIKLIREKKQYEKERRILKNSISKAFSNDGEACSDILQKEDAEKFLADEVGLAGPMLLPPEGRIVCSLVGFQRFALMMIGSKIQPKGGQKPWSWEKVLSFVRSIRDELKIE